LIISIRRIADINKPLFSFALLKDESYALYYNTLSVSLSVNADEAEVITFKSACDDSDAGKDFMKVFVN